MPEKSALEGRHEQRFGQSVTGLKRTASGIARRNISGSTLSLHSTMGADFKPVQPPPLQASASCPELSTFAEPIVLSEDIKTETSDEVKLSSSEKKLVRLERNRNAARLRRHKRRLVVDTLDKEHSEMEVCQEFLKQLKLLQDFDPSRLFGVRDSEVVRLVNDNTGLQEQVSKLVSEKRRAPTSAFLNSLYQTPSSGLDTKATLLNNVIGNVQDQFSWCPKRKQQGVELFLFDQNLHAKTIERVGKRNLMLALLANSRSDDLAALDLTNDQRVKLRNMMRGMVIEQVKLKIIAKLCNHLYRRKAVGQHQMSFSLIESNLNAFRSVLEEEQLENYYRLASLSVPRVPSS